MPGTTESWCNSCMHIIFLFADISHPPLCRRPTRSQYAKQDGTSPKTKYLCPHVSYCGQINHTLLGVLPAELIYSVLQPTRQGGHGQLLQDEMCVSTGVARRALPCGVEDKSNMYPQLYTAVNTTRRRWSTSTARAVPIDVVPIPVVDRRKPKPV